MEEKSAFLQLMDEGQALYDAGQYNEAIKLYKTAFVMEKELDKQQLGTLYIKLANAYYKLENMDKYTYYYEEYLKDYPQGQASVFTRLAYAYYYIDCDKCVDYHDKAINLDAGEYDTVSKLFGMIKSPSFSQKDIKEESEYEVERVRSKLYNNIVKYNHDNKKFMPDKKLNLAYLSCDCYTHTMMNYMLPIFENHNKDEFNVFMFNGTEKEDSTTEKIKNCGFEMINCFKMNNEELAKTIYEKQIDILIDLGGYTHCKSYMAFYKPAPIIISYLGYLNTMGIKEFDYILTDRYTIPEDKANLYTEKPLYLDAGYQVFNCNNLCDVEDNPYKTKGYITFGSFNCTSKINDTMIYIWSKILKEVENSKLLIYRTRLNKTIISNLKSKFDKWGIDENRILYSNTTYTPHYKAYSFADISLDPFPFSGMSIALECALMGVPTITLVGEGMQSKGAGRINEVIGNGYLNANCGQEYVDIAVQLANDKEKLNYLRSNLRQKVQESPIMTEYAIFTRDLENKLREVWKVFTNSN